MRRHRSNPSSESERPRPGSVLVGTTLLVMLSVLVSACSSASSGQAVASLPGGHGGHGGQTAATGPPSVAQSDQDFVNFSRCMRAHGVAMSDPVHLAGHQGLSITDLPPRDPATNSAWSACEHYVARIEQAKAAAGHALSASNLQALTNYAQCMRNHDISMLDPGSQGELNLGDVPGITSDFGRYSPQFRSADAACRHLLPAGVHDDGTGP